MFPSLIHSSIDKGKHIDRVVYALTDSDSDSPGVVLQLEVGRVHALGVDPLQVSPDQQRHAGIATQQGLVSAAQLADHVLVRAEGAARWRRSSGERGVREQKCLLMNASRINAVSLWDAGHQQHSRAGNKNTVHRTMKTPLLVIY